MPKKPRHKTGLTVSAHRKSRAGKNSNIALWRKKKISGSASESDGSKVSDRPICPASNIETANSEQCSHSCANNVNNTCSSGKELFENQTVSDHNLPQEEQFTFSEYIGVDSLEIADEFGDDLDWLEEIPSSTPKTFVQTRFSSEVTKSPKEVSGRRIIDVSFFIAAIQKTGKHTPFDCSFSDMDLCYERQMGMIQEYTFVCRMCKKNEKITSEDSSKTFEKMNVNTAMVTALTNIGQGYSQLEELCCSLDMPCMSRQTFTKHQSLVDSAIHDCTWESMEEAAREEAAIAKAAGCIDSQGVPEITVIVDGAWCKRSYKTNYNALSGVGCIIGLKTRKVLFIGVRNSYCCICARAQGKNLSAPEHICYKNWSKTSTAMESDIIVEGFKMSKEMYNLKYVNVIGDGDSSVMSKLIETQPYGSSTNITKIECTNHLLRNYIRKLREVSEQKRNEVGPVPGELRNKVKTNLLRLRYAVTGAVKYAKGKENLPMHDRIRELQEDIRNGPHHVFGDHSKCKEYFCSGQKDGELNLVEDMKAYGLWQHIISANSYLAFFTYSLLQCVTTNLAETYNSIVCKFVAGKRVNLSQRNTYTTRSEMSALAMNEKEDALRKIHKKITFGVSPGAHSKVLSRRRLKKRLRPRNITLGKSQRKRVCLFPDKDYGIPETNIPDISAVTFENRKMELLESLTLDEYKRQDLEKNSRGQSFCDLWLRERKRRLTASNFGKICKMRQSTSCQNIVEQLLYKDFAGNSATRYGLEKENIAIGQLEELLGIQVQECGLYIDHMIPYLAASPDGVFGEKGLVEIKCPASAQHMRPTEAVDKKVIKYCTVSDGELVLKKSHSYHYQIQGQLHIMKRKFCVFVVWTPLGMSIEKIERDDDFWKVKMESKLKEFYDKCLLPEIIDPRHPRGLPIRDRV